MDRRKFIGVTAIGTLGVMHNKSYTNGFAPAIVKASNIKGVKIYQYASKGPLNHSSNSFFIETPDGVFVIDAQWTLSEAQNALNYIKNKTNGKPLLGLLITHDHTDHYGGTKVFMDYAKGNLKIYASSITTLSIKNDAYQFQKNRKRIFGDDFPDSPVSPNQLISNGDTINLGTLTLNILDRNNNEATSTSLVYVDKTNSLIVGDIVYDKTYAIFRGGFSGLENWKLQLEELKSLFSSVMFCPGHGSKRIGQDIIEEQIRFLLAFRDPIFRCLDNYGTIDHSDRAKIKHSILKLFPKHKSIIGLSKEQVIDQSIDWLSSELDKLY